MGIFLIVCASVTADTGAAHVVYTCDLRQDEVSHALTFSCDDRIGTIGVRIHGRRGEGLSFDSCVVKLHWDELLSIGDLSCVGLLETCMKPYHTLDSSRATRLRVTPYEYGNPISILTTVPVLSGSFQGFCTIDKDWNRFGMITVLPLDEIQYEGAFVYQHQLTEAAHQILYSSSFQIKEQVLAGLRLYSLGDHLLSGDARCAVSYSSYQHTVSHLELSGICTFHPFVISFGQKSSAKGFDSSVPIERQLLLLNDICCNVTVSPQCLCSWDMQMKQYQQNVISQQQTYERTITGKLKVTHDSIVYTHASSYSFRTDDARSGEREIKDKTTYTWDIGSLRIAGSTSLKYDFRRWDIYRSLAVTYTHGCLRITGKLRGEGSDPKIQIICSFTAGSWSLHGNVSDEVLHESIFIPCAVNG